MDVKPSISEDHGIAALTDADERVFSIGISTGGVAEVRMVKALPQRHVTATTIDEQGVKETKEAIANLGLEDCIEVKYEDVSRPLPYPASDFDFIYARLVLHYLSKQALERALSELYRVLKPGGRMFVVVRSTECEDAKAEGVTYDPETCLTTRHKIRQETGEPYDVVRYYHTEDSITGHLKEAGFTVNQVLSYTEQLYSGFQRTVQADSLDHVIEVLVQK